MDYPQPDDLGEVAESVPGQPHLTATIGSGDYIIGSWSYSRPSASATTQSAPGTKSQSTTPVAVSATAPAFSSESDDRLPPPGASRSVVALSARSVFYCSRSPLPRFFSVLKIISRRYPFPMTTEVPFRAHNHLGISHQSGPKIISTLPDSREVRK